MRTHVSLPVPLSSSTIQLRQNVADISSLLHRWQPRALNLGSVADLLETSFEGSGGAKGKALDYQKRSASSGASSTGKN
jgi:hypothetical protein